MSRQDEFVDFAQFCLNAQPADFDPPALTRFVRRGIADMPLLAMYLVNVRYSPHLLREFVYHHWNAAISALIGDDALAVAADVTNAIRQALTVEEQNQAWDCITRNYLLPLPIVRKLCAWLEGGLRDR